VTNKVEIVVVTKDDTRATNAKIKAEFIKLGDELDKVSKSSGTRAGDSFSTGTIGGFKRVLGAGAQLGSQLSGVIGDAVTKDPKLTAGIVAGVVAGGPIIGAALSGAIIGAVGAGGVIGAFAVLKDDARIKAAGDGLADNLLGTLKDEAQPAVAPLLQAIGEVDSRVAGIGDSLGTVFANATGSGFQSFVVKTLDGVEDLADSFATLSTASDQVFDALGDAAGGILSTTADGLEGLADNGAAAADSIKFLGGVIEGAISFTLGAADAFSELYEQVLYFRHALGDDGATQALTDAANAAAEAERATNDLGTGYQDTADALEEFTAAQEEANDALFEASGGARDAITAQIEYREAVQAAKDAVDGKNAVSDKELSTLVAVGAETDRLTQSLRDNGASAHDMAVAIDSGRQDVENLGVAMGMSREDARKLAEQIIAVPDQINVDVAVQSAGARTRLQEIQYLLGTIRSKTITVDVIESIYRQDDALARRANGRAAGGPAGGMTLVGEMGPELVRLPYGSSVMTNGDSARASLGGGGGGSTQVILSPRGTGDPFSALVDALIPYIQATVRTEGGGDVNWLAGTGTW
jgi:hypothetical protein